jgi:hypothetical protein
VGLRQLLTTALRTKLGATLLFGVRKPTTDTTAYFHCLSLHLRMQKCDGQDKFLSALPRPPAGPYAVEKLHFLQNSKNLGDRKCLGKLRKSFVGHPDKILFSRISLERVFQHLQVITLTISEQDSRPLRTLSFDLCHAHRS